MTQGTKSKKELEFSDNKLIPIRSIVGLDIKKFRSMEEQKVQLGDHVTVLSGRNGTMKTSIMGLIAHPFDGEGTDAFGKPLKTALKDVFRLSPKHDDGRYEYDLILRVGEELLREPVSIYWVADNTNRHRVVVSGAEKGDGNFSFNTSFLNLQRLFPLVHTNAAPDKSALVQLSDIETKALKDFYERIFPSSAYGTFAPIHQKRIKTTFAPDGDSAEYDWQAISSGEDNLGAIFNRMLGFQRTYDQKSEAGNGIFCIDEFESSLHPVAQLRLFDYLYKWSQRYRVQVVISTHSLHLIQHLYLRHSENLENGRIAINFISKSQAQGKNAPIIHNPSYELAFKELTLEDPQKIAEARKVKVFCEDDFAIHFAKRIIGSQHILNLVEFHSSLDPDSTRPGTSYSALSDLCIQYPLLLQGSFVLFDADVPDTKLDKIRDKLLFLRFPDKNSLALERRIVSFIISLDNADPFFKKFNKERDKFLDEFKEADIQSLTISDVENDKIVAIKACKRWADKHRADFKKYVTYYAKTLDTRNCFAEEFLKRINRINAELGLPLVAAS